MSDHDEAEIVIRSIDTVKVISRKIRTNEARLAEEVRRAFNEVGGKLLVSGGTQKGSKFIRFHVKGAYNPDKIDLELCVPVAGISKPPIDWELVTVDGHKTAASIIHTGPYNKEVKPTYDKLFAWLNSKGLGPIAPIREIYLHEPFTTPADMLETEIVCPLPDGTTV